jgi:alkanesulfonate monooxygenase SsuD/methylene tetrahydromethanopterin reductase-like flavin-dependent oxidoreductase (luciferase family)
VRARSIGLAGSTPAASVRRLAPLIESLGYRALWINDTPGGDALAALGVAAEVTSALGLATGVLALDRQSGVEIAARVRDLPAGRVRVGIGSGGARHGLAMLEAGVAELREGCDAPIVIGALGPRTRALAARIADGILFNWLSPEAAADAMADLRRDAAGRAVAGILYARTIAEAAARSALETEAARYAGYPAYAANFERQGVDPIDTTIDLTVGESAGAFEVVDELVLRVVTATGSDEELESLLHAGAPTAH